jgi:regulator of RNase E activity RraA
MDTKTSQPGSSQADPFRIRKYFEPLRVVDVCDALDGIGYFNIGLVSEDVRPLWLGMRFWGVAYTLRCVPANKPMWKLDSTEDIVNAHGYGSTKSAAAPWASMMTSSPATWWSRMWAEPTTSASGVRRTPYGP